MKSFCVIILGCFLLLGSCNENSVEVKPDQSFIPLTVGNQWTFRETTTGLSYPTPDVDTISFVISDSRTISNTVWYRLIYVESGQLFDPNVPWSWGYKNSSIGLFSRAISSDSASSEFLHYKYPTVSNESVRFPRKGTINGKLVIDTFLVSRTISIDTLITVPAGTFHCVHYQIVPSSGGLFSKTDEYISPSHGWIKRVYVEYLGDGTHIMKTVTNDAISIVIK